LQPATYPFDPNKLIGGSIVVDDGISQMNDLARITELTALAPMSVGLLMSDRPPQISGTYWSDNIFTWDSESEAFHAPPLFMPNYKRYPPGYGLLVAALKVTIDGTSYWNWLVFDPELKQVDRIDPESTPKPALDSQIETFLSMHDLPYIYQSGELTREAYRSLVRSVLLAWECPEFVHLNAWGYWLLYLRLFFGANSQHEVFAELKARLTPGIVVSNLLLNFYGDFTNDANVHTFGSGDFVIDHPSNNDLWRYEPMIAARVRQLTGFGCGRSQLNQLISAALRDIVTKNGGCDYRALYCEHTGEEPRFIPNSQDAGEWIPKGRLEPGILALLATKKLRFGYVDTAPYVYKDPHTHQLTGLDHALGRLIAGMIAEKYDAPLEAVWVEVPSSSSEDAVSGNLVALYQALVKNHFDAALSGQMILRGDALPAGVDPEWTSATAMLFTNVTFTGRKGIDAADIEPLRNKSRDELLAMLAKNYPGVDTSFFSVTNPGPSYHSTTNLVRDLNAQTTAIADHGLAAWVSGTVKESSEILESQRAYFVVGDSIAGAYQAKSLAGFKGIYLNMPAVQTPSIWSDPDVGSATLLPIAAFTLRSPVA
jgi:hypothetical protein